MSNTNECIECKSEIHVNARKCTKCGEYQSLWRRGFIFFAGVTGGLTFLAAGLSYVSQSVPEILARTFPTAPIEVLSFADKRHLIVMNTGDGDIFLRAIQISNGHDGTGEYGTSAIVVGETVAAGATLNHTLKEKKPPTDSTARKVTIAGEDGPVTQEWVDIANHVLEAGGCYESDILHANDPIFQTIRSHYAKRGTKPMTMPHRAYVRYYSFATNREHTFEFPVIGLVYQILSQDCGVH